LMRIDHMGVAISAELLETAMISRSSIAGSGFFATAGQPP
jgi:hypothetical protein